MKMFFTIRGQQENSPFAGISAAEAGHFSLRRSGLDSRRVSVAQLPSLLQLERGPFIQASCGERNPTG